MVTMTGRRMPLAAAAASGGIALHMTMEGFIHAGTLCARVAAVLFRHLKNESK